MGSGVGPEEGGTVGLRVIGAAVGEEVTSILLSTGRGVGLGVGSGVGPGEGGGVGPGEGGGVGGGPAGSSLDSITVGGAVGSSRDSSSSHSQHLSRQTLIQSSFSEPDRLSSKQSLVPSEPSPFLQLLKQSLSFSRSHLRSWSRSGNLRSSLSLSQHFARQLFVQLSDDSLHPFLLRQVLTHFCSAGRSQWSLR